MNQHQRKFLLEAIETQYKSEKKQLTDRCPTEPSMNNYLIAAILDGSFRMREPEAIRQAMRERVRNLGKNESLLGHTNTWRDKTEENSVILPAGILFEHPAGYALALAKYIEEKEKWDVEMKDLDASIGAMRIKVQIGSDNALLALVEQADKLCSMSLTASNRLLLGNGRP